MNLMSCTNCGIVVNVKNIEMEPEYIKDGEPIDPNYDDYEEYHNKNLIWGEFNYIDTWKCPVCKEFNGVEE